jgi:hypothetical protein
MRRALSSQAKRVPDQGEDRIEPLARFHGRHWLDVVVNSVSRRPGLSVHQTNRRIDAPYCISSSRNSRMRLRSTIAQPSEAYRSRSASEALDRVAPCPEECSPLAILNRRDPVNSKDLGRALSQSSLQRSCDAV